MELTAAHLALKVFTKDMRHVSILLRLDNTTAIAYINKMGGIQFPELNKLARNIWQWCEVRNIHVLASYIPSKDNTEADVASRNSNIDTEWELSKCAFNIISKKWGPFDIDLFASKVNAKNIKFCSWKREPDAYAIDAFTLNWQKFLFYAFPPFALIAKVVAKIAANKANGVLIVPYWPTQPWFLAFMSLCKSYITFKPSKHLLLSPCRSIQHLLAGRLSLIAGHLSGSST